MTKQEQIAAEPRAPRKMRVILKQGVNVRAKPCFDALTIGSCLEYGAVVQVTDRFSLDKEWVLLEDYLGSEEAWVRYRAEVRPGQYMSSLEPVDPLTGASCALL